MEHLIDRSIFFGLGVFVGLFMNTIVSLLRDIKEKVNEVDDIVKKDHENPGSSDNKTETGKLTISKAWTSLSFLIIALLVGYAAAQAQQRADDTDKTVREALISRCQAGVDNRNVQRELVEAVYNLATGVVQQPKKSKPLTREEVRRTNEYISKVNAFRLGMYLKIKPSEDCRPYVDDDHIRPPTDPFPSVPLPPKEPR